MWLLVKKGDTVSKYLLMAWQAVAAFLACARIGAVHSVIFAGFSAEALCDRIQDCDFFISSSFPVAIETKPGSATVPFFGIEPAILDLFTGRLVVFRCKTNLF